MDHPAQKVSVDFLQSLFGEMSLSQKGISSKISSTSTSSGSSSPSSSPSSSSSSFSAANLGLVEGIERLPFAHRIILESLIRNQNFADAAKLIDRIPAENRCHVDGDDDGIWNFDEERRHTEIEVDAKGGSSGAGDLEIQLRPTRVLFQDFAGLSSLLDLAAIRDAAVEKGVPAEQVGQLG